MSGCARTDMAGWEVSAQAQEDTVGDTDVDRGTRTTSLGCLCRRGCPDIDGVDVVKLAVTIFGHGYSGHGYSGTWVVQS